MNDLYIIAFAVTITAHFMFLGYLLIGGLLALRWPRTISLHVAAVAWGFGSMAAGLDCPLTSLEQWTRQGAGMAPLPSEGFIYHYITGVLYPANDLVFAQVGVLGLVIASWVAYGVMIKRRSVDASTSAIPADLTS